MGLPAGIPGERAGRERQVSQDRTPISEQPLPAQLVVWAVSLAIIVVVLAVAARAAMWIVGLD